MRNELVNVAARRTGITKWDLDFCLRWRDCEVESTLEAELVGCQALTREIAERVAWKNREKLLWISAYYEARQPRQAPAALEYGCPATICFAQAVVLVSRRRRLSGSPPSAWSATATSVLSGRTTSKPFSRGNEESRGKIVDLRRPLGNPSSSRCGMMHCDAGTRFCDQRRRRSERKCRRAAIPDYSNPDGVPKGSAARTCDQVQGECCLAD